MTAYSAMPPWEKFIIVGGCLFVAVVIAFFVGAAIVASLNDSRKG